MSAEELQNENPVKFQITWPFKVDEFGEYAYNQRLCGPEFITIHNNIGFRWKMYLNPNGCDCSGQEYHNHIGLFLEYQASKELRPVLFATFEGFVDVDGKRQLLAPPMEGYNKYGDEYDILGNPSLLPVKVEELRNLGLISSGNILKLGMAIKIHKSMFDWRKILEERKVKFSLEPTQPFLTDLFHQVLVCRSGEESEREEENQRRFDLNFKIQTSDGMDMLCHRVVLRRSKYFQRMFDSELNQNEARQVKVTYDSKTMLEVVHFIYKDAVSPEFLERDLLSILDASKRYLVPPLRLECEERLIEGLDVERCGELLVLADRYDLQILREMSLNLMSESLGRVWKADTQKQISDLLWQEAMDTYQMRMRVVNNPY